MLKLTVSQDGCGDFASISEAVLAVPYELEAEICIGPGIYREKLVCEKRALTLRGAGAAQGGQPYKRTRRTPSRVRRIAQNVFHFVQSYLLFQSVLPSCGYQWQHRSRRARGSQD